MKLKITSRIHALLTDTISRVDVKEDEKLRFVESRDEESVEWSVIKSLLAYNQNIQLQELLRNTRISFVQKPKYEKVCGGVYGIFLTVSLLSLPENSLSSR